MKIEPNGRKPAPMAITYGSKYHFLSGIGRGTTLIRQGISAWPLTLLPIKVPIKLSGMTTKTQIATIANYE